MPRPNSESDSDFEYDFDYYKNPCYKCASHNDTHMIKQMYVGYWGLNTYDSVQCLLKLNI